MRSHSRAAVLALAALLVCLAGPAEPGSAAPHGAAIVSVVQAGCGTGAPCRPGQPVRAGSVVGGTLDVRVTASADLGLEWVRLEAQNPGEPRWYCIEQWAAANATTFAQTRRWSTIHWTDPRKQCAPNDCSHCIENSPHHHGAPTEDVPFALRVVAREQGRTISKTPDDESPVFELKLQNAPVSPSWLADPVASTTADGRASVLLRWAPNPEERAVPPEPAAPPADIREYRFVRTAANGTTTAYAISAANPGAQGCRRVGNIAYECSDEAFGAGASGTYSYAIAAVRASFTGARCEVSPGTCLIGPLSEFKTVSVAASPAQSGSAQPTPSASGTASEAPAATNVPEPVPTEGLTASKPLTRQESGNTALIVLAVVAVIGAAGFGARRWLGRARPRL